MSLHGTNGRTVLRTSLQKSALIATVALLVFGSMHVPAETAFAVTAPTTGEGVSSAEAVIAAEESGGVTPNAPTVAEPAADAPESAAAHALDAAPTQPSSAPTPQADPNTQTQPAETENTNGADSAQNTSDSAQLPALASSQLGAANEGATLPAASAQGSAQGSAVVSEASAETGITVQVDMSGVDGSNLPLGVHVGVVLRGTAVGSKQANFIGKTTSLRPVPASGTFTQSVLIAPTSLDRTQQYEAVVWPQRTNPSAENIVAILPFEISQTQWNTVLPDTAPTLTAEVANASATALTVQVTGTGARTDTAPAGLGIALRSVGGAANSTAPSTVAYLELQASEISDGQYAATLTAAAKKLQRSSKYEVAVWALPSESQPLTPILSTPLPLTEVQWAALQPGVTSSVTASVARVTAGTSLDVTISARDLPGVDFAYVALLKTGTSETLTADSIYPAMQPFAAVKQGALKLTLTAKVAGLQRGSNYEIVVWKQHTLPTAANVYARTPVRITSAQWDALYSVSSKPEKPKPQPKPLRPNTAETPKNETAQPQQSGSLVWAISSSFADYTTNPLRPAKGSILTDGVGSTGSAYVFPQASGGSWNAASGTGSVQYSGVVTFTGHHGMMTETFSNPVITVHNSAAATLTADGRSFGLNLAAATKTVGETGEVSWANVPVAGAISGSGAGGGGSFAANPLSFTVGGNSNIQYGSTATHAPNLTRTAAEAPPATTGITVLTPASEIVPGGDIELSASGFTPNERNVLVVMYSEPTVLDQAAGADEQGVVRWIGTLPKTIAPGTHTLTLQGSVNAGVTITVNAKKAQNITKAQSSDTAQTAQNASALTQQQPQESSAMNDAFGMAWGWWVVLLTLITLAVALLGFAIAQRRGRRNGADRAAS